MFTFLVVLIALALAALVALLWYGVRTHKSVAQLRHKIVDAAIAQMARLRGKFWK